MLLPSDTTKVDAILNETYRWGAPVPLGERVVHVLVGCSLLTGGPSTSSRPAAPAYGRRHLPWDAHPQRVNGTLRLRIHKYRP